MAKTAKKAKAKAEDRGQKAAEKTEAGGRKSAGGNGQAVEKPKKGGTEKEVKPEAIIPEVLPKGALTGASAPDRMAIMVRHEGDVQALQLIESSIQRDIQLSGKLDKAGAMVGIKIGLALQAGKSLLRHGEYEGWVCCKFGEAFSERKAQYFSKLASAFLTSKEGATLAIPKASEAGNWLVVADEGSALQTSVADFVGDLTLGELLDKHGVRPVKSKGGWRPAEWLVAQYQSEHETLKNKAFDVWPKEDQEAFRIWQEKQVAGDDAATRRMAAEATWHGLRVTLSDHGLGRKTWALIPKDQLVETHAIMSEVLKGVSKAIKEA